MGKVYNKSTGYRARKRKFHGHKKNQNSDMFHGISASAKKLRLDRCTLPNSPEDARSSNLQGYRIVNISIFISQILQLLSCKTCNSEVEFLEEKITGCASVFSVSCAVCKSSQKINTSPMLGPKKSASEVNLRMVYTMRCLGLGLSGLRTFCSVMDMPPPPSQKYYDNIVKKVKCATKIVAENSMKSAAIEESTITGTSDVCVSGDGTWKTRGHTSKIGVCSVIGTESGKVIDVEVLSSFCKACENSSASQHDCKKNHTGSSGIMEVIGMRRIFERSEENRQVRYLKYLGDGDAKTFLELSKAKPYGDVELQKLECIAHVQKRMGTRLRKLKQQSRGEKLPDGKTLGGKGRLTDKFIDKLTVYYGNAIRSNSNSLQQMREAVWATYCHLCSTDAEPMHMFCPKGINSWCKFQRHAACTDEQKGRFQHTSTIPIEVMKSIKVIYKDLSAPNLLRRCLSGKTQNANESFNSVIWKFCPKNSGCGKTVAEVAVFEALINFNEGSRGRINTLKELGINPGVYTVTAALKADAQRVTTAERRADFCKLETRRAKRMAEKRQNEEFNILEGTSYEPGKF